MKISQHTKLLFVVITISLLSSVGSSGLYAQLPFNQDPNNPNMDFSNGNFDHWELSWYYRSDPEEVFSGPSGVSSPVIVEIYGNNQDGNTLHNYNGENIRIPRVPDGLERVGRFGDPAGSGLGYGRAYTLKYHITVNADYPILHLQLASIMDNNHGQDGNTHYKYSLKTASGQYVPTQSCTGYEIAPMGKTYPQPNSWTDPQFSYMLRRNLSGTYDFQPWESISIDLSGHIGETLTLELEHYDCSYGVHGSYTYVSAAMRSPYHTFYFCQGAEEVILDPYLPNFKSYLWSTGETTGSITVNNPVHGTVYTCEVESFNGCVNTYTYTISEIVTTPDFSYSNGTECNQLVFEDASSTNYQNISAWEWDFGDPVSEADNYSTEQNPAHSFASPGTYTVTLKVTTEFGCIEEISKDVVVRFCGDLQLEKELVSQEDLSAVFKISIRNNSSDYEDENVIVTDLLPSGYSFVSYTATTGTYNSNDGVWTVGIMQPLEEENIEISVNIVTGDNYVNIATITGDNIDEVPENNSDAATIDGGQFTFTKQALTTGVSKVGDVIDYQLVIENTSPIALTNVEIVDENADVGSINPDFMEQINPYASAEITASRTVTIQDFRNGQVSNQAILNAVRAGVLINKLSDDPETIVLDDPTVVSITRYADLDADKDDGIRFFRSGEETTYKIIIRNNGPSSAVDVLVEDPLPGGVEQMYWTSTIGTSGSGALEDVIELLQPGEFVEYAVTLTFPANIGATFTNSVFVGSEYNDHDPVENCTRCQDTNIAEIPKGISPNGDGKNDTLDLEYMEVVLLIIFNRYGREVYSKNNYKNEWEGQSNNGNELPTGTYFYNVVISTGETLTGYIYLVR